MARSPHRPDVAHPQPGRVVRRFTWWVTRRARWVVAAWAVVVVACTWLLPPFGSGGDEIESIIPRDSPAISAEVRTLELFGFPLSSRTVVVQRNPDGLPSQAMADAVTAAYETNRTPQAWPMLGAAPVPNALGVVPGTAERGTAVLTYLYMNPISSFADQLNAGRRYVATHLDSPDDAVVGVAGSVPARAEQSRLVTQGLPMLELATIAAIVLLVGLNFRSVLAPFLALGASAVAFVVTQRVAGLLGQLAGISVPAELEPLLVALLLGVVTDYTIFYVSAFRLYLEQGHPVRVAVRDAVAGFTPIVIAAGLTVAAGTASLLAATSGFFRTFGPGMAIAVLIGLLVSVTLIPALLSLLGRAVLWPSRPDPHRSVGEIPGPAPAGLVTPLHRGRYVRWLVRPRVAAAVLVVTATLLALAALPALGIRLGVGFVSSLPADNPVRVASAAAAAGFAPGITAPTTLLIEKAGVAERLPALTALERAIEREPGVAGVIGPADNVVGEPLGVVLARDRSAARMLVILSDPPLGARALTNFTALQKRLPTLLQEVGLQDVEARFGGDTALASELVESTRRDLVRIGVAALAVNLALLVIFLRALVAPLALLAASVLALGASLGLTAWMFQGVLGWDGLTFYVPFAAAVLLVAFGSDYNIFGVGHVWEVARHRPLREAIVVAVPQSTRAITAAGITLAASFGLLAVVPLRSFAELAFAMGVGILLDAVVVRSILVPCMLTLLGSRASWPAARLGPRVSEPTVPVAPVPTS